MIPSGEQVIQSHRKQTSLQAKGLDACSYLYSRTFKRLSSTPALYQRQQKASKHYSTIFKHLCICSCFRFYFPVIVVSQLSLTNTVLHQRVRHCWQGNIIPCEIEGVFIKINNLGMQVMWYHHLYLSIWN